MDRARRILYRWHRWLVCLAILLAACVPQSAPDDSAVDEEGDGLASEDAYDQADADKALANTVSFLVAGVGASISLASLQDFEDLRDMMRRVESWRTLRFSAGFGDMELSFSLPASVFVDGRAEGMPLVPPSLIPTLFRLTRAVFDPALDSHTESAEFTVDPSLFEQELRALSAVTFGSFARRIALDFLRLDELWSRAVRSDKPFGLEHESAAYRILARTFYSLIASTFSDAARAAVTEPTRTCGAAAWTFVMSFLKLGGFARRKRLIGASAPLILTTATVASLASMIDLPPELIPDILVFLCGA